MRHELHPDLVAIPVKTEYDHDAKIGRVTLAGLGCTDMTGAIAYFRRIDPKVTRIETFNEDGKDIVYVQCADGEWLAVDHRRVRRTAGSALRR